jgi:type IV pilus assembly protein PilX
VTTGRHSCNNPALLRGISTYQSGAVLIISLIMLLLLTIIGASSIQTTSLEEKMAGNLRNANLAFQAAESALRAGEADTATISSSGFYTGSTNPITDIDWTNAAKRTYSSVALYIIETPVITDGSSLEAGTPAGSAQTNYWYRITACGTGGIDNAVTACPGGTANALVILQSIFKR